MPTWWSQDCLCPMETSTLGKQQGAKEIAEIGKQDFLQGVLDDFIKNKIFDYLQDVIDDFGEGSSL